MITSKQRSVLKGIANGITSCFQIGKGGVSENVLNELNNLLDNRELIKVTVLQNSDVSAKQMINELALSLKAEPVAAIGNKMVLYRYSNKDGVKHLEI